MTPSSAGDPPAVAPAAADDWPRWVSWLALLGILAWGASVRFHLPQTPLSDPDTWGYLRPAISELLGRGFIHTYGRNFVYPGWLYLILRCTGDFRAIGVVQHLLGLATGVVLWMVWQSWRRDTLQPRIPRWTFDLLGLAMTALYLGSVTVVYYEQRLRPESIFPFFVIAAVWLQLRFVRAWFCAASRWRGGVWAGAALFAAAFVYQLKPSFGLAVGVAALPWMAAWFGPRRAWRDWRDAAVLATSASVAGFLALLLLIWPEHRLAQADQLGTLFLPETLLTVHADVIRDTMAVDLRTGDTAPYTTAYLQTLLDHLNAEIRASQADGHIYGSLGFNPDYLLYHQSSFCHFLYQSMSVPNLSRLAYHFYFRAWTREPWPMLRNVGRQLAIFYAWQCPACAVRNNIHLERDWARAGEMFGAASHQEAMSALAAGRAYLTRSQALAGTRTLLREPFLLQVTVALGGAAHLDLLMLMVPGWILVACLPAGPSSRALLGSGALVLFFAAFNFGTCLTVALVHSFDVDRYSVNQFVLVLLFGFAAFAWLCECLLTAWSRLPPDTSMGQQGPP